MESDSQMVVVMGLSNREFLERYAHPGRVGLSGGITPVDVAILDCTDARRFITIRQVKGGAVYDGAYLGKAVRWYYAKGETRHIAYATNGNKVARSDGARPLMELPEALPADIDYQWYTAEAMSILSDVGAA